MSAGTSHSFTGWRAFSVYGVEGESGTIYLSANGTVAHTSDTSPMGRALAQLAAIQMAARSSEEQSSRVGQGANAYTADRKDTRDEHSPSPLPDLKEIVEKVNSFQFRVSMADWETLVAVRKALLRLAGERDEWKAGYKKAVSLISLYQMSIDEHLSSRTQAEGKMKGYGLQTINDPQHCTGGGE